MESEVVQAVAEYAEFVMGQEGFRYISAVVATCKMLALELEGSDEEANQVNMDALVISAYLHNVSTIEFGFQDHQVKSAEMSVEFLHEIQARNELVSAVEKVIFGAHNGSAQRRTLFFAPGSANYLRCR